jgi:hypothetical protein
MSNSTRKLINVPLADDGACYPVIIFSPGMGFLPIKYAPMLVRRRRDAKSWKSRFYEREV